MYGIIFFASSYLSLSQFFILIQFPIVRAIWMELEMIRKAPPCTHTDAPIVHRPESTYIVQDTNGQGGRLNWNYTKGVERHPPCSPSSLARPICDAGAPTGFRPNLHATHGPGRQDWDSPSITAAPPAEPDLGTSKKRLHIEGLPSLVRLALLEGSVLLPYQRLYQVQTHKLISITRVPFITRGPQLDQ